jgi:hypothetical protein
LLGDCAAAFAWHDGISRRDSADSKAGTGKESLKVQLLYLLVAVSVLFEAVPAHAA